jgi:hypothetical protein
MSPAQCAPPRVAAGLVSKITDEIGTMSSAPLSIDALVALTDRLLWLISDA